MVDVKEISRIEYLATVKLKLNTSSFIIYFSDLKAKITFSISLFSSKNLSIEIYVF